MSESEKQKIMQVRPWQCDAMCDAPECHRHVDYAVMFRYARPIDTLYLCYAHLLETTKNYGVDEVPA